MSSGSDIHGAQIPSPRWWRPVRDVPLIILAILSLLAALLGWTVQFLIDREDSQIALLTPAAGETVDPAVAEACRASLPARDVEPWVDDPDAARQVWDANAAALADPVVLGEEGWAFYNDQIEENFSQTVGRRLLTVGEVRAWHDYFAAVATALEEQGIEFSIQITPSSGSVYPEMLPEWSEPVQGSTPIDQLLAASPDLPIVDFRAPLRAAAEDDAVYTPVNSHWTDWGGYVGWEVYADCHAALHPSAAAITVPETSGVAETGIFNEYAQYGVPDAGPEWTVPEYVPALADYDLTDGSGKQSVITGGGVVDLLSLPATTQTQDAASDRTALILRDSMGNALSPLWANEYAQTWQVQHRYDDWSSPPNFKALVDQHRPDVVIVQLAERHLVNEPTAGPGY